MNCACTKRAAGADRQLQLMVMEFNFRRGRIRDSLNVGTEGPIGPLGRDHEKGRDRPRITGGREDRRTGHVGAPLRVLGGGHEEHDMGIPTGLHPGRRIADELVSERAALIHGLPRRLSSALSSPSWRLPRAPIGCA